MAVISFFATRSGKICCAISSVIFCTVFLIIGLSVGLIGNDRRTNESTTTRTTFQNVNTTTNETTTTMSFINEDLILVIGGNKENGEIFKNELISLNNERNLTCVIDDLPENTTIGGAIFYQDAVWICETCNCLLLNAKVQHFEMSGKLPQCHYSAATTVLPKRGQMSEDHLLISGGFFKTLLDTIEEYDGSSWQISKSIPRLPILVMKHCLVLLNNSAIILIGGLKNFGILNQTYIFNFETDDWSQGPELAYGRFSHICSNINGSSDAESEKEPLIIVAGGINERFQTSVTIEILYNDDETGLGWSEGPSLPDAFRMGYMISHNNSLLWLGGSVDGVMSGKIYRLDYPFTSSWILLEQKMEYPRQGFFALSVPSEMFDCQIN